MSSAHKLLSVDPGMYHTGLALWERTELSCVGLLSTSVKAGEEWLEVVQRMSELFDSRVKLYRPTEALIETPEYHGTASGHAATASGNLHKLTLLVGSYVKICWSYGVRVETVYPSRWKGQLPKDVVVQRVRARLPDVDRDFSPKRDVWDALGIGLHALGRFS